MGEKVNSGQLQFESPCLTCSERSQKPGRDGGHAAERGRFQDNPGAVLCALDQIGGASSPPGFTSTMAKIHPLWPNLGKIPNAGLPIL